jgi:hypothetical protein
MKIYFAGGLRKNGFQEFNNLDLRRLLSFGEYATNFNRFEKELGKMGYQIKKKRKRLNREIGVKL